MIAALREQLEQLQRQASDESAAHRQEAERLRAETEAKVRRVLHGVAVWGCRVAGRRAVNRWPAARAWQHNQGVEDDRSLGVMIALHDFLVLFVCHALAQHCRQGRGKRGPIFSSCHCPLQVAALTAQHSQQQESQRAQLKAQHDDTVSEMTNRHRNELERLRQVRVSSRYCC